MDIEWDEAKRRETLAIRHVDFNNAALVFSDPGRKTIIDDRRSYGEVRYLTLGRAGADYLVVAHTQRGSKTRIITAWKVGPNGQSRFEKTYHRRDSSNE